MAALQNPGSPTAASQQKEIEEAARTIGLRILFWQASTEQELETAFEAMAQNRILALLVGADAFFAAARVKARATCCPVRPCRRSTPCVTSLWPADL